MYEDICLANAKRDDRHEATLPCSHYTCNLVFANIQTKSKSSENKGVGRLLICQVMKLANPYKAWPTLMRHDQPL